MSTLWDEAIAAREQFRDLRRIEDEHGSSIEPPLNEAWDDITQLRWHAAAVEYETGIRIIVTGPYEQVRGKEHYSLNIGRTSVGSTDFHTCWTYMNGVRLGAQAVKENA